jgi:predicted RecA/RadA family phage recombinase
MAKNRARHLGRKLWMRVADINGSGAGNLCKSGDPGIIGVLPVVCLTDEDADGNASVDTMGVYNLTVTPTADIAEGDPIFWDNAAGTLGDDNTDDLYGVLVQKGGMLLADGAAVVEVRVGRA